MTRFASTLFAAAALTTVAPAFAATVAAPIAFERDGIHYVAKVIDRTDGSRVIAGHEVESGRPFELIVNKGVVNGTYNGQYVSYDAPRTSRARLAWSSTRVVASNVGL